MNKETGHGALGRRRELLETLPALRRFAHSLTGNLPDADDLLQSTVERLLERGLPEGAELLPWAMKVCRNLWIDEVRSRKVRRDAAGDPAVKGEQVVQGEQQVIGELSLREVQQALAQMPPEQRSVLELVAVEGRTYRQAAEILETPIGTIMSRLARARAALIERTHGGRGSEPGGKSND